MRPNLINAEKQGRGKREVGIAALIVMLCLVGGAWAEEKVVEVGLEFSGLIFKPTPALPSNHASTVAEMPDGSILCAWYAGSAEAQPDVAIYVSRYQNLAWSKPQLLADTPGRPEGNPVLFVDQKGRAWLFFVTIHGLGWDWAKIKYLVSEDGGFTWPGVAQVLREKRGWMTRNHPLILRDNRILLPLYSEQKWCSEFMVSPDQGQTWQFLSEVCSQPGNIQPAVVELDDGSLYATMRTGAKKGEGKIWQTRSQDGGKTWSPPEPTALPNPNAGTDMIRLKSGRLLLAFNNSATKRTPLSLALSEDGGHSWRVVKDVETEEGEFSYPSLCQAKDGTIHLTYTWRRQSIKHLAFTEEWLK